MISEHIKLAEDGVRLVELRLDFLRRPPDLGRLLPNRPTPVIVTARRKQDGGLWNSDEDSRLRLLRTAIAEGVDYVDLEYDTAKIIPRYHKTKRIVSYHNFEETPADLDRILADMKTADPDLVKIVTTPRSISDVFRMFAFLRKVNTPGNKIPVIGFCMTEMGVPTRVLGGKFGVPFGYATFSDKRILAPGMLYYKTMRDQYQVDRVDTETDVYGVIADPIAHTLSPLIHNASFKAKGMNRIYLPFQVKSDDLSEFLDHAPEIGVRGLSVTIPHTVAVIPKLTQLDPAVEEISACNTILYDAGKRFGYNTDYLASVLCIETAMGRKPGDPSPLEGKKALVMGAGGAGLAVAYGLMDKGARVTLTDINDELAEKVAGQFNCDFCPWEMRQSYLVQILANCTPVGMFPNVDDCPIGRDALRGGMYVFDAVYNPENTCLLRRAREKGCTTISGIEMFIGQACLQFKLFTGQKASAKLMRGLLKKALAVSKD